jgi:hypothetical protein
MRGDTPPLSNTPSWCGAQFKKEHRDFTLLYFTLKEEEEEEEEEED